MRARRLAAALMLAAIGFVLGRGSCRERAVSPPHGVLDPAQLTWAAEGIMERISELEDELARVLALMEK